MKAMVFAAGRGTRLAPFTDSHPKALAPVGGRPMLLNVLQRLKDAGITDVTVNVHHFPEQVIHALDTCGIDGLDIHVSDESDLLLDTGGAIVRALPLLRGDEPVLIHNVDIYSEIDFADMLAEHLRSRADATMLVDARDTSRYLLFDDNLRMRGWTNIRTGQVRPDGLTDITELTPLAFGGIHILSPTVLDDIARYRCENNREVFSIIDYYVDRCQAMNFHAYRKPVGAAWFDIGDTEKLRRADLYASTKN